MSLLTVVRAATRRTLCNGRNLRVGNDLPIAFEGILTNATRGTDIPFKYQSQEQLTAFRAFSSDEGSVKDELVALVSREIEEETGSENSSMPEELKELMDQISDNWRIVTKNDDLDSATVQMFKREPISGGGKVSISFHCQDSIPSDEILQDELLEDDEETAVAVRFQVRVNRAGKTLVMKCLSMDAEASVERVYLDTASQTNTGAITNLSDQVYHGPEFEELAQDLQETFTAFVQTDCGVDENVASFISMYADYREQTEYVDWLKGVRSILESSHR